MQVLNLTCDYMHNPIGFDFIHPVVGWMTSADQVNGYQSAYQIQVSTEAEFLNVCHDSGRVESDLSAGIRLELQLNPRTRYYWRVRIWDGNGTASDWSQPAFFETAKYSEPWQAEWIGWDKEFPQLRGDFLLTKPIRTARAYACGVGLYTLYLNGSRVGDEYLTPGINAYDSWLQYQTYDITGLIRSGSNAIGAQLGNGYYKGRVNWPEIRERFGDRHCIFGNQLAFICEIHVIYEDGEEAVFGTNTAWHAAYSPFKRAEIYDGEVFDARNILDGWCTAEVCDSKWETVKTVDIDMGLLHARKSIPVRLHERFKPQRILHTPAGETVLDFGQNLAGLLHFRTDAPAGTELLFQFGEALDKDGNFYRDNMRTALAEIRYICDGQIREYRPSFTFFGFRYVKITGLPGDPDPADYTSEAIYSDMPETGHFKCSDSDVNQLFSNSV
ncbi:MAG: family 78 glycoside hydrolase catalytic domain, partial [Clostridia bacterium]|nr:family 78 glycoside hydrolase catalytic domain [Clostridia bacterium]